MAIEIPEDVAAVSLALVGGVRVLLRSDGRFHCTECETVVLCDVLAGACAHVRDVAAKGLVRTAIDEDGRRYPEFVWHRGGGKTVAHWPAKDDPDGAWAVLVAVLGTTVETGTRSTSVEWRGVVADQILANLRAKGYIVVPEWAGVSRERNQPTGRGARVLDLGDDPC